MSDAIRILSQLVKAVGNLPETREKTQGRELYRAYCEAKDFIDTKTGVRVMEALYVGAEVRVGGLAPGVGKVIEMQPNGALILFDDCPIPNAHFWFEILEIDGAATKSDEGKVGE